jgi:hypothetical protein
VRLGMPSAATCSSPPTAWGFRRPPGRGRISRVRPGCGDGHVDRKYGLGVVLDPLGVIQEVPVRRTEVIRLGDDTTQLPKTAISDLVASLLRYGFTSATWS